MPSLFYLIILFILPFNIILFAKNLEGRGRIIIFAAEIIKYLFA